MGSDGFQYMGLTDFHYMEWANFLVPQPDHRLSSEFGGYGGVDMVELIQSSEDQMISPTGLQPEASNVPTLISPEPNNAKPARRKNYILIEKGVIEELSRRGITLKQAAILLLVSRSTLKRRCKDYGITDWRSDRKKNGGTANKEIQLEYTMRVKGEELKVMFPVNSNTPLETLRKNLKIRLDELHPREEGQRIMVLRVRIISDGISSL